MRSRRAREREIDLRRSTLGPDDEVVELDGASPAPPPPIRLYAGLPGPAEAEYVRPSADPTSLASLWRAAEAL